jgi:hypothetical protein
MVLTDFQKFFVNFCVVNVLHLFALYIIYINYTCIPALHKQLSTHEPAAGLG